MTPAHLRAVERMKRERREAFSILRLYGYQTHVDLVLEYIAWLEARASA